MTAPEILSAPTDGNGHTTMYRYNSLNKLAAVEEPSQQQIVYQYDRQGRMTRQIDRNEHVIEYAYNFDDQLVKRREASGGAEEVYAYNEDGLQRAAVNDQVRYDYANTPDGRLAAKYSSEPPLGTRRKREWAGASPFMDSSFGTGTAGLSGTTPGDAHDLMAAGARKVLECRYDLDGQVPGLTDAAGRQTEYRYDKIGRIREVLQGQERLAQYRYGEATASPRFCSAAGSTSNTGRPGPDAPYVQLRQQRQPDCQDGASSAYPIQL
ncbi:hypothetical protein ABU162_08960 [Paenibacillus thiaminolyticus]|uniref:hypothetical protein n=1 Tax=Paenibacillus thiaminolyticus TaxID=49283 RepID=UPI0035A5884B